MAQAKTDQAAEAVRDETSARQVEGCETVLISDEPSETDLFGSHDRIAEAMADLIRNSDGGKAIGIEGGWGSGKTTVVRLLKSMLEAKDKRYEVVLFDAWAHEGDPLRRSFLESLLDHLINKKWLDEEKWIEEKEILQRKLEKKSTTTVPHFTLPGKFVILSLALVPIGNSLVSATAKDITYDPRLPVSYKFLLGLLLLLAPALTIIFTVLIIKIRRYIKRPTGLEKREEQIWSLFIDRASTQKRTETNETPVPTSIEFENTFAKIMKAALEDEDPDKARRLVLVLDNLDRIEAASAISIWSTLQTFLRPRSQAERYEEGREWLKRVWVCMPYDAEGLSHLWGEDKDSAGEKVSANGSTETIEEITQLKPTRKQNKIALSFLDKSFQIRFEVPPPALSNWHSYLSGLLNDALPDHHLASPEKRKSEFHACYRLYAWYLNEKNQFPTPRGVKLYVNQIGALHRQWKDEYSLTNMAYYVLLRRLGYDVIEMLLENYLPHSQIENLFDENVTSDLAGLAFNINRDEARQIILEDPIKSAIDRRSPDDLVQVKNKHKGFWETLEKIAEEKWGEGTTTLANAAYCLSKGKLLEERDRDEVISIKRTLRKTILDRKEIWTLSQETAEGLAELVKLNPEEQIILHILQVVGKGAVSRAKEASAEFDVQKWFAALSYLMERLRWRGFVVELIENGVRIMQGGWDASERPVPPPAPESVGEDSDAVYGPRLTKLFELICEPITKRLRELVPPVEGAELNLLFEALTELDSASGESPSLSAFAREGFLLHYLLKVEKADFDVIANCLFLQLDPARDDLNPEAAKWIGSPGMKSARQVLSKFFTRTNLTDNYWSMLVQKFASRMIHFNKVDWFIQEAKQNDDFKPFFSNCLSEILQSKDAARIFRPSLVFDEWEYLVEALGKSFYNKLENLVLGAGWVEEAFNNEFDPAKGKLYIEIARKVDQTAKLSFEGWLINEIGFVPEEIWLGELKASGPLIELVQYLMSSQVGLKLGGGYQSALTEHGKMLIDGRVESVLLNPPIDKWENMALMLATRDESNQSAQELYDEAAKKDGDIHGLFFETWGDTLSGIAAARDKVDVFEALFIPIVKKNNGIGIQWLARTLSAYPNLTEDLSKFLPAIKLTKEVEAIRISGMDAGTDAALSELKDLLRIEPQPEPSSGVKWPFAPINYDVLYIFDRQTFLPAENVTVSNEESGTLSPTLNMTVDTPEGRKRFSNVRYDNVSRMPGTYLFGKDIKEPESGAGGSSPERVEYRGEL